MNSDLRTYCDPLGDANRSLNEWIERLLEFTEMSREDVRKVVEHEKSMSEAFRALEPIIFTGTLIPLSKKGEQNDS